MSRAGWPGVSDDRREVYAAAIAWHFERAGQRIQASDWYGRAAQQARRAAAPEAAERFFVRAIELLPDEPGLFSRRVQQFKGLWDMQWWQGMYSEALETGKTLLAAAEAHADPSAQAAAWNRIAAVQNRLAEHQPALYSVQRAERLARAAGASQELVLALFNRGVTLFGMGNSAGALEAGEKALAFNQSLLEAGGDNQSARDHTAREIRPHYQPAGDDPPARRALLAG